MVPPRSDRISRVPPYSRIYIKLTCTGLSPTMACLSRQFQFFNIDHWPGPRSLATTNGVSVDVLSSGYLDVSVHQVRFVILYIQITILPKGSGFPHSDIFGSKFACNSPKLFAACHVLHRLYAPRYPPNALKTFDLSTMCHAQKSNQTSSDLFVYSPQSPALTSVSSGFRTTRSGLQSQP